MADQSGIDLDLGGLLTLQQAWRLAKAWYQDRLDPSWQRKGAGEVQALFTQLGLTSLFWDLGSQYSNQMVGA